MCCPFKRGPGPHAAIAQQNIAWKMLPPGSGHDGVTATNGLEQDRLQRLWIRDALHVHGFNMKPVTCLSLRHCGDVGNAFTQVERATHKLLTGRRVSPKNRRPAASSCPCAASR